LQNIYNMSTTFGVQVDSINEDGCITTIDVARRNSCGIYWVNDLAQLLPDEQEVQALDNSHQGIYTIGDIKKSIYERNNI